MSRRSRGIAWRLRKVTLALRTTSVSCMSGGEGRHRTTRRLFDGAAKPPITVPAVVLHGEADGIALPPSSEGHARHFTGPYQRRLVPRAGHALPQDAPQAVADAVLALAGIKR